MGAIQNSINYALGTAAIASGLTNKKTAEKAQDKLDKSEENLANKEKDLTKTKAEKDEVIKQAVIGPSEAILTIKSLPLNEKLALWKTREEKLDYYRKMDISEYLLILDKIKRYKLREEDQWDLLKVPFDVTNEELMDKFLEYVDEIFIAKLKEITKPTCFTGNLDDLEIYYQKINMYYSFSKIFNLNFDSEWVYSERLKVSEDINEILVKI